jgi:hypothetical protein
MYIAFHVFWYAAFGFMYVRLQYLKHMYVLHVFEVATLAVGIFSGGNVLSLNLHHVRNRVVLLYEMHN